MNISAEERSGTPVVTIEGEIDLYSSPDLRKELKRHLKAKPKLMVIDLAGVEYIDSSGVATLIESFQELGKSGGKLRLAGPTPAVLQVFKFVHLENVFDIASSLEEALTK